MLLPGIFIVIVTWLGARLAIDGSISAGELVAFYGYAAFLVIPLRVAAEAVDKVTRALVGAQRMLAIVRIEPLVGEPAAPEAGPAWGALLADARSGLVIEPGVLTCVVTPGADEGARLADRLGRFVDDGLVTLGGVPVSATPARGAAAAHRRQRDGPAPLLRPAARGARPVGPRL